MPTTSPENPLNQNQEFKAKDLTAELTSETPRPSILDRIKGVFRDTPGTTMNPEERAWREQDQAEKRQNTDEYAALETPPNVAEMKEKLDASGAPIVAKGPEDMAEAMKAFKQPTPEAESVEDSQK